MPYFFSLRVSDEHSSPSRSVGNSRSGGRNRRRRQLLSAGSRVHRPDEGQGSYRPATTTINSRGRWSASPRGGIHEIYACSNRANSSGALRTALLSLDRTHYQVGDKPKFEVTIENVDSTPIRIPISPDLADLQPKDPAQKFNYSELQTVLWIAAGTEWSANTGGVISLYGADDHADTMLTLNPGESVRIIGEGKFSLPADGLSVGLIHLTHAVNRAYAEVSIYRNATLLASTAVATVSREVCLRRPGGQRVAIVLTDSEQ